MSKLITVIALLFLSITNNAFSSTKDSKTNNYIVAYEEATLHFLDGTSVKGYGKIVDFLGVYKVKFKLTLDDKPDVWDELMIKGITLNRELNDVDFLYVKVMHKLKPNLLEVVDIGEISIFVDVDNDWVTGEYGANSALQKSLNFKNLSSDNLMYSPPLGFSETSYTFYVKKETEEKAWSFSEVINFKKAAREYFKDCPGIIKKINNKEFRRGDIVEMVYYYNDYCAELD